MNWEDRIWKITAIELLERYAAGERNFNGIELIPDPQRNIYDCSGEIHGLEGANLRGISLRGANLRDVVFTETDLSEADLFGACLFCATLANTTLKGANLYSVSLVQAGCAGANFDGAVLTLMDATNTRFGNARIGGFENAILACANFKGSNTSKNTLCSWGNLIWHTTMPDGTIEEGPYWGEW
jgi:uncharacterized protein YjbI with pentapeptide repeats